MAADEDKTPWRKKTTTAVASDSIAMALVAS